MRCYLADGAAELQVRSNVSVAVHSSSPVNAPPAGGLVFGRPAWPVSRHAGGGGLDLPPEFGPVSLLLSANGEARRYPGECCLPRRAIRFELTELRLRWRAAALLSTLLSAALSGCGSIGSITEETGTSAFVAPGKFDVYTCADIDLKAQYLRKRKEELEQLMGRASEGAGGAIINTIAYQGEYLQSRDDLAELKRASTNKQCASNSQWSSGRALF